MDEAKFIFERGCEQLILGSAQMGNVHLLPEAEAFFREKGLQGSMTRREFIMRGRSRRARSKRSRRSAAPF